MSRFALAACAILFATDVAHADAPETVVVEGARLASSPDICLKIAEAKVREWQQPRMLRDRTDTLADGTRRDSEMIFTENSLFLRVKNMWRSGQVLRAQRRADDAADVAKRMGLDACSNGGEADSDGQTATRYVYAQPPDLTTEMWVSNATGLPLRMMIHQPARSPGQPVEISLRYVYGDGVSVPHLAELAQFQRMKLSQDWLTDLQMNRPTH
jgi:hypothetical protein